MNVDIVCYKDGCHGDNSGMILLNDQKPEGVCVHPEIERLSRVTRESMFIAIDQCKPGVPFSKIGETIQDYANAHNFFVNEEFGGHGIAHHLHMPPLVHHLRTPTARKEEMRPGMAFTIEPILMMHSSVDYK